ncbi:helix-turn-helix domain-containing protein [Candidatus Peregrinibacteria bacterium]|nr:helix-turn-helix domain-containing protein [Candidatus Peregrinibacteria bacterium]
MIEKTLQQNPGFSNLCKALAALKTEKQVTAFLRDVATLRELNEMSERLEAAQLIEQGLPYRAISKKTGASTTTVARVAWWLNNGEGGYNLVLGHHVSSSSGKRLR